MILNPKNIRKEKEGWRDGKRDSRKERRNCLSSPRFSLFRPLLCLYIWVDSTSDLWGETKDREPPPTN